MLENSLTQSSGNIYEDLAYENADSMKVKAELVRCLHNLMRERGFTQQQVADLTGIPQPRLSKIFRGQFREVSEYRLMECLSRLGNHVEIKITPCKEQYGDIKFVFA